MTELRVLCRQIPHYFLGRVGLILLGFISFPILTRLLTVAEYGEMSLILKVVVLATAFSKLGVQNAAARFYEEYAVLPDRTMLKRYYSTVVIGTCASGAVVSGLLLLAIASVPAAMLPGQLRALVLIAAGLVLFRSVQSVILAVFRVEGRTKAYNLFEVSMKAGTVLLLLAMLLYWKAGLKGVFLGTAIAEGTAIALGLCWLVERGSLRLRYFSPAIHRELLAFGVPLIVYELASIILDSGDRFLIQHFLGTAPVGYYSAAYNMSSYIQDSVLMPVGLAIGPIYIKIWVNQGREATVEFLNNSLETFIIGAIGIVAGTVVTSRDGLILLASHKYAQAHTLLPVLVAGLMIYSVHIFLNASLAIHKKSKTAAGLVAVACGANLALNVVLLPRMGLHGAAWATLLSYLLLIVLMARVSTRLLPLTVRLASVIRCLAIGGLTVAVTLPLETGTALTNFLVKGTASVALYTFLLAVFDKRVRELLLSIAARRRNVADEEAVPAATGVSGEA